MTIDPSTYRVSSNRRFWLSRGIGAAVLAVACALSLRATAGFLLVLGVAGFLMFGVFTAYALRQWLRRGPRLTLDEMGFNATDLGVGTIEWAQVEHLQTFGSTEAPFIAFHVRDAAAHLARMSWWPRMVVRLLAAQGIPMFSISLIGVDRDPGEIWRKAMALRHDALAT